MIGVGVCSAMGVGVGALAVGMLPAVLRWTPSGPADPSVPAERPVDALTSLVEREIVDISWFSWAWWLGVNKPAIELWTLGDKESEDKMF